jgi:hypothetical protein
MALTDVDVCNLALAHLGDTRISSISSPANLEERVCAQWYDIARKSTLREHPWNWAQKQGQFGREMTVSGGAGTPTAADTITGASSEATCDILSVRDAATTLEIADIEDGPFTDGETLNIAPSGATRVLTEIEEPLFKWKFQYMQPTDFIRVNHPWLEREVQATSSYTPSHIGVDQVEYEEFGDYILSDYEDPFYVVYTYDHETPDDWDDIFLEAFSLKLAIKMAPQIAPFKKEGLVQEYELLELPKAKRVDANQSKGMERRRDYPIESDFVRARYGGI